jgi:site-specific DNA-adenine methylase
MPLCSFIGEHDKEHTSKATTTSGKNKLIKQSRGDLYLGLDEGFGRYNTPKVMMYLDPPYLKEHKEKDDSKVKLKGLHNEYNPGMKYTVGWQYAEHVAFLKIIQKAKCKILLSGYDDSTYLYERYLEEGEGLTKSEKAKIKWQRVEYETSTAISNNYKDIDRKRKEVLWYNYDI